MVRTRTITSITSYGAIGVQIEHGQDFKVNGQRLKHYLGEQIANEIVNYICETWEEHIFLKKSESVILVGTV